MSSERLGVQPPRAARPRTRHASRTPAAAGDESAMRALHLHGLERESHDEELRRARVSLRASRDALAESEQRYRELFDAAPVAYLMLELDGRISGANAAAAALLGPRPLEGRRFSDFVAPERQELWHRHRRALLRGQTRPVLAIELRSLEGTALHVELASTVARNEAGPSGLRLALLDVTERHEAERAAHESARRAQLMADALPVLVAYLGADERCRFANAACQAWFGKPSGSLQGRSLRDVIGAAAYATVGAHVPPALAGQTVRVEGEIADRRIGARYVELTYAPDANAEGTVRGFYLVMHDLTELRRTQRALRATAAEAALVEQLERRRLAEDLHDDAGQTLSLASVELRALSDAAGARERARRLARVRKLVADARERVASLSFQLSPPMLHDVGLVAAAQWLGEDLARSYGLEVRITAPDELSELDEAMRVTLFRALRELLINVARHAGSREARVRLDGDSGCVEVEVADAGRGFDPRAVRRGFGLRSLRDRIEHLGGSLRIDSAPGRGTTVSVRAPLVRGADAAAPDPNGR